MPRIRSDLTLKHMQANKAMMNQYCADLCGGLQPFWGRTLLVPDVFPSFNLNTPWRDPIASSNSKNFKFTMLLWGRKIAMLRATVIRRKCAGVNGTSVYFRVSPQ